MADSQLADCQKIVDDAASSEAAKFDCRVLEAQAAGEIAPGAYSKAEIEQAVAEAEGAN